MKKYMLRWRALSSVVMRGKDPRRRRKVLVLMALTFGISFCATTVAGQPGWLKDAIAAGEGYEVDKDANILILHQTGEVEVSSGGHSSRLVHLAMKVLSQPGTEKAFLIENVGEGREIKGLSGWRVDSKGECHKLEKKHIVEVDVGSAAGYYNDVRQLVASFPDTRTGDVVAYEYKVEEKGEWESFYQGFTFQRDLPVIFTRFSVTIPSGWQHTVSSRNLDSIEHTVDGSVLSWTYRDLPYRKEEPLMPPWEYVNRAIYVNCYDQQKAEVGHFGDWRSICQWGADLYEKPSLPDEELVAQAGQIIGQSTDPWDRFCAIAKYVRDNIRYVGVEIGEGRLQPRSCGMIWSNKYGDCKDKVTLMRALLRAVDIDSRAVLASHKSWVDPKMPSPFQFDHVILSVPGDVVGDAAGGMPGFTDGWLYFDPTDEAIPPGWLPAWLHGEKVLGLSGEDSSLVRLKSLDTKTYKRTYRATANLMENNSIAADIRVVDYGARAHTVRHDRANTSAEDILREWRESLSASMSNPLISDLQTGSEGDSTWITFHVTADNYLNHTGEFGLLKVDFFHPDGPNELSAKERIHPVWFGRYGAYETDITWNLPEGIAISELPASDTVCCESANFTCSFKPDGHSLRMTMQAEYDGTVEDVENYAKAREFYRSRRAVYEARALLTNN
ncbi:MAG: DUF3857 domain-containing protein [Candidatus Zixiibacteriota bacterium]